MTWNCAHCGKTFDQGWEYGGRNFCSQSCQRAYYDRINAAEEQTKATREAAREAAEAQRDAARIAAEGQENAARIAANAQKDLSDKEHFRPFIEARAGRPLRMDEIVYNWRAKTWGLQEEIQAEQSAMLAELSELSGFDERVIMQIPTMFLLSVDDTSTGYAGWALSGQGFNILNETRKTSYERNWHFLLTPFDIAPYIALYRHLGNKWPEDFEDYYIAPDGNIVNWSRAVKELEKLQEKNRSRPQYRWGNGSGWSYSYTERRFTGEYRWKEKERRERPATGFRDLLKDRSYDEYIDKSNTVDLTEYVKIIPANYSYPASRFDYTPFDDYYAGKTKTLPTAKTLAEAKKAAKEAKKEKARPGIEARTGGPVSREDMVWHERLEIWALKKEVDAEKNAVLDELSRAGGIDLRVLTQDPDKKNATGFVIIEKRGGKTWGCVVPRRRALLYYQKGVPQAVERFAFSWDGGWAWYTSSLTMPRGAARYATVCAFLDKGPLEVEWDFFAVMPDERIADHRRAYAELEKRYGEKARNWYIRYIFETGKWIRHPENLDLTEFVSYIPVDLSGPALSADYRFDYTPFDDYFAGKTKTMPAAKAAASTAKGPPPVPSAADVERKKAAEQKEAERREAARLEEEQKMAEYKEAAERKAEELRQAAAKLEEEQKMAEYKEAAERKAEELRQAAAREATPPAPETPPAAEAKGPPPLPATSAPEAAPAAVSKGPPPLPNTPPPLPTAPAPETPPAAASKGPPPVPTGPAPETPSAAARCQACKSPIASGAKFCHACGAPVQAHCPHCGAETVPGEIFCSQCGKPAQK